MSWDFESHRCGKNGFAACKIFRTVRPRSNSNLRLDEAAPFFFSVVDLTLRTFFILQT